MNFKARLAKLEKALPKFISRPLSLRQFYGGAAPLEEDWPYPPGTIRTFEDFYTDEAQMEANILARESRAQHEQL